MLEGGEKRVVVEIKSKTLVQNDLRVEPLMDVEPRTGGDDGSNGESGADNSGNVDTGGNGETGADTSGNVDDGSN